MAAWLRPQVNAAAGVPLAPPMRRPICSVGDLGGGEASRTAGRDAGPRGGRRDREQLVQVLGDHQNRGAAFGEIEERLVDARGGAGIDAPGRLGGDQDARALLDLAPDDEFLQIAAGKRAASASTPDVRTSKRSITSLGVGGGSPFRG